MSKVGGLLSWRAKIAAIHPGSRDGTHIVNAECSEGPSSGGQNLSRQITEILSHCQFSQD